MKPGGELALSAKSTQALPSPNKHVLGELLRALAVPGHSETERIDPAHHTSVKIFERSGIAGLGTDHQGFDTDPSWILQLQPWSAAPRPFLLPKRVRRSSHYLIPHRGVLFERSYGRPARSAATQGGLSAARKGIEDEIHAGQRRRNGQGGLEFLDRLVRAPMRV